MLTAVSIVQIVSWGILYYASSVFLTPMQAELGWSTVELTGAYSLMLFCGGLAAVPVGRWLDRHGSRALMTVSSILAVLLVLALVASAEPAGLLPDYDRDWPRLGGGALRAGLRDRRDLVPPTVWPRPNPLNILRGVCQPRVHTTERPTDREIFGWREALVALSWSKRKSCKIKPSNA